MVAQSAREANGASGPEERHRFYGRGFQFSMTVMGDVPASSVTVATRNRWPSEETMYW